MGWLKEWDKCVFRRANPPKKRRYNEEEEEEVYVSSSRGNILLLFQRLILSTDRFPWSSSRTGTSFACFSPI